MKEEIPVNSYQFSKKIIILFVFLIINTYGCLSKSYKSFETENNKNNIEKVEIGGVLYNVPKPWKGNRIETPADPRNLVIVPYRFTDGKKIYVTKETREAFISMATEAQSEGVYIKVASGYRSYDYQAKVIEQALTQNAMFNHIVKWTAPPGYSEHISGEVLDFIPNNKSFKKTRVYQWLHANASRFCFKESYPEYKEKGFEWEPWHWKYEPCEI